MRPRRVLVCFSLICCLVPGQTLKYVLHGETAIFETSTQQQPDSILWKYNDNRKVVEFDGSEAKSFGSYEHRIDLDYHSAQLSIRDVRFEDSGIYELEAFINHKLHREHHQLEVLDKVAKPTISCEMHNANPSDEPGGQATLLCSSPSRNQSLLTFQWSSNAKIPSEPKLVISLGGEHDDHMYNCTVLNELTQESTVFLAKDCYPEIQSRAGLIAGVIVAVVLCLIIGVIFYILCRKVCLKLEKKPDMENQLNPSFTKEVSSESEETQGLLDRAPTIPSKQTLGLLVQRNDNNQSDPPHKDKAFMNELRESVRRHSPSGLETNKIQDSKNPAPSPAPDKPPRTFSDRHAKENGKGPERNKNEDDRASCPPEMPQKSNLVRNFSTLQKVTDENTHPEVIKKQGLDDPADAGNPNEVSDNQNELPESLAKEDDPVDSEETQDALTGALNDNSPEKNKNEDNRASHCPEVPQKSNLVRNFSALQKATNENASPRVKKNVLDDPADSGNPNELSDNQNSEKKKEENESEKPTSENDVQPPPVAKENSPLSQNSPKISPKDEHKQDISSDELAGEPAKKSTGGSASLSSEESENEEQGPPATTPEKTDPDLAEDEQKPPLTETESEVETQKK